MNASIFLLCINFHNKSTFQCVVSNLDASDNIKNQLKTIYIQDTKKQYEIWSTYNYNKSSNAIPRRGEVSSSIVDRDPVLSTLIKTIGELNFVDYYEPDDDEKDLYQLIIEIAMFNNYEQIINLNLNKPNQIIVDKAANSGNIRFLNYSLDRWSLLPSSGSIDCAAMNGHIAILEFGLSQNPPISPSYNGMNFAAMNNYMYVLEFGTNIVNFLEEKYLQCREKFPIFLLRSSRKQSISNVFPNLWGMDYAAKLCHLDPIIFGTNLNPPIFPTRLGVQKALENGHTEIVEFCAQLNPPIVP
ncbi:MAG: hypothetical protein JKX76_02460 [Colwellia sp.]|nr:hypothetical protein [Colwellia sp.]